MEEDLMNPVAKKTKELSGSVLLTYFQGDINSMVDQHFSRALSQAVKPKEKSAQTNGSSQWETHSQTRFQPMLPPEHLWLGTSSESHSNYHMSQNHPANSGILWPGDPRHGMGLALPPMMYPSVTCPDGLIAPEDQYSNSLLHLLHNDRPDTKQDLHMNGWTKYPGFCNQRNLKPGMTVIEKKDFDWY
ncbi:transcription cofactor vestigial-like protein 1 [Danio aesculapii]|uniref:transcription cofactor vestigial-like protein 1 n=1 Tax=Danio aesculapii TaxID=1142201 RepID=UPI0024C00D39|nr:transcription cofactor vestigial-like protein 1 [Danio aesculapii]